MWRILHGCLLAVMLASGGPADGEDWREFRGPNGSSSNPAISLPTEWDIETGENVAWQAELPGRGVSGPIVVASRVFATASSGPKRDRLHLVAFDSGSGKQLWHRRFWATGRTLCHPMSAVAAPTPASDGQRVFAFYSSNDLVCLDLDGNVQWIRGLVLDHPRLGNDVGMSSSPVVAGDVVVVQCETQASSFAAAYDCKSGEERWSIDRPREANWASPIAIELEANGEVIPAVILHSGGGVSAYAASSGEQLWDVKMGCSTIPSAAGGDGTVYVPGHRGLSAIATAIGTEDRTLWSQSNLRPSNPSPVVTHEQILLVNGAGVLTSASLDDGSTNWKKRLGGKFWATPVAAGGYLYAVNDAGEAIVVDLEAGAIVGKNGFGDDANVLGSPAIGDGALFVRTHRHLWKIAHVAQR